MNRDLGSRPEVAETHVSTVFFTADRAYKLLKPLQTSFLDHRSAAQRITAVDQELELNRRLAPHVYLGVAPVIENGVETDRMLVMRRMPAERRLSHLLTTGSFTACLRAVARRIAAFHAGEPPHADGERYASRDAVRTNWVDNLQDVRQFGDPTVLPLTDEVEAMAIRYLDHSTELFAHRLADGWVRDGHGDLTAEDIFCTAEGPQILDCLAFAARYRIADVLNDVAFLAMDVDRLAGREVARQLFTAYAEFSGEHHPDSLAWHYVAYRASVRAKVDAIRLAQGDVDAGEQLGDHLQQCRRHLHRSARRLILIGGAPGTGKSTLASGLGDELEVPVLRSDAIRRELTERLWTEQGSDGIDEGAHAPVVTSAVYDTLFSRADTLLRGGWSVVLDASFARGSHRERARHLATRRGADLHQIRCVVDYAAARGRIEHRRRQGHDPSDAQPSDLATLTDRFEPWPEATDVSTDGAVAQTRGAVLNLLDLRDSPTVG